ncbi:MAG TPA: helix-hairpin-helix domain-containing protein [Streptosporangiaceae bacterium]|nr:helix-hairpin-helix domain-containing protein [Streptosporangiaceae bacterium]
MPLPPFPPVPPITRGGPEGIGWAVIPMLTCGFGTSPAFAYAAVRQRSAHLARIAAGHGVATAAVFLPLALGRPALTVLLLMINWVVGSVHAFAERPKVFPSRTPRDHLNQHAIEVARYRRGLRAEARRLVAEDPELANDLRIGRPELPRTYDDGGLVDVNHASAEALALLPEMTPEMIERIILLRAEQGGFVSAAELALHADLPPDLVNRLTDYVIFLP